MGLPVAVALTHLSANRKSTARRDKDAVHVSFASWHAIRSGMLKMREL
jgi:hypothetical protein